MTLTTRRCFMAGALSLCAVPGAAQSEPWRAVSAKARSFEQCHAMIVKVRGTTVLSEVYRGPALTRAVPIKSVSKTLVAALTGAALDRGEIPSVDTTLATLAPQLIPAGADPRVKDITVADLITMQAGLERTSGANYGGWVSSSNWVADALSRPMVAEPGSRMLYSTGSFHVLGALLAEIAGQDLLTLARRRLGQPLGIEIPAWTRDPQGRYLGGNEMALTLPGLLRFGEMYLNSGQAEGVQVLSKEWVEVSLAPRTRSPFSGLDYGYGWFLGGRGQGSFALGRGYGGQIICIAPKLQAVIAISSDPTRPARSGGYFGDLMNLIEQDILPAARQA